MNCTCSLVDLSYVHTIEIYEQSWMIMCFFTTRSIPVILQPLVLLPYKGEGINGGSSGQKRDKERNCPKNKVLQS